MDIDTALAVAFTKPADRLAITHQVLDRIGTELAHRIPDILMHQSLWHAYAFLQTCGIPEVASIITIDRVQEAILRAAYDESLEFAQAGPCKTVEMLKAAL